MMAIKFSSEKRRPNVGDVTCADDVSRWYWTRSELTLIAQQYSLSTQGTKEELLRRIVNALDKDSDETPVTISPAEVSKKSRTRERLTPPFSEQMAVPPGQPFTRELRAWLSQRLGRNVTVSQAMRDLMKDPQGQTLADLLAIAREPRAPREISAQFELNRFMRIMAARHPEMSREEKSQAWGEFKELPAQERAAFLGGDVIS